MNIPLLALTTVLATIGPTHAAHAANDTQLQRLALCQDSWHDWKDDEARMARFVNSFESRFNRSAEGDAFTPKSETKVMGHAVTRVHPQSVGMGVGFSLVVDANSAKARTGIEQQLGKPMHCSVSEGVRSCELKLGPSKTLLLMTGQSGQASTSLMGCYYFYQQ